MLRGGPGNTEVAVASSCVDGFESISETMSQSVLMLSPPNCKPKVSQAAATTSVPPLPGFFVRVRSGLLCLSQSRSFYTPRGKLGYRQTGWMTGGSHQFSNMPKRVYAPRSQIPLAGVDPFESMESRRRRLFPQSVQPPPAELPGSSSTDQAHQVPDAARSTHTVERIPKRADAPVLQICAPGRDS